MLTDERIDQLYDDSVGVDETYAHAFWLAFARAIEREVRDECARVFDFLAEKYKSEANNTSANAKGAQVASPAPAAPAWEQERNASHD